MRTSLSESIVFAFHLPSPSISPADLLEIAQARDESGWPTLGSEWRFPSWPDGKNNNNRRPENLLMFNLNVLSKHISKLKRWKPSCLPRISWNNNVTHDMCLDICICTWLQMCIEWYLFKHRVAFSEWRNWVTLQGTGFPCKRTIEDGIDLQGTGKKQKKWITSS